MFYITTGIINQTCNQFTNTFRSIDNSLPTPGYGLPPCPLPSNTIPSSIVTMPDYLSNSNPCCKSSASCSDPQTNDLKSSTIKCVYMK